LMTPKTNLKTSSKTWRNSMPKVRCPEADDCSQIGCRHRRPHEWQDNCSKRERGNIINGCRQQCVELPASEQREVQDAPDVFNREA
jgi:hypothetical protein